MTNFAQLNFTNMKITIIGAGNMGGAIARGFAAKKVFAAKDITCCDRSDATLENLKKDIPAIGISKDNVSAVKGAGIVLFAVKPWILQAAVEEVKAALDYKKQLIISIAAGVGLDKLAELFDKKGEKPQVVYLIPNIAVEVGAGVFFYCSNTASKKNLDLIQKLFGQVGFAKQVEEKQMTAGTALASCGIAYVFRYIRANVEGGVEMGLYPKDAQEISCASLGYKPISTPPSTLARMYRNTYAIPQDASAVPAVICFSSTCLANPTWPKSFWIRSRFFLLAVFEQ